MASRDKKKTDEIYVWLDESGKTVYSNVKKEKNVSVPPQKGHKFSQSDTSSQPAKPLPEKVAGQSMADSNGTASLAPGVAGGQTGSPVGLLLVLVVLGAFALFLSHIARKVKRQGPGEDAARQRSPSGPGQSTIKDYHVTVVPPSVAARRYSRQQDRLAEQGGPSVNMHCAGAASPAAAAQPLPESGGQMPVHAGWSLEFVRSLEWREFEKLCARILNEQGYRAELGRPGADEGVDIRIYQRQPPEVLYALAQCKAQRQDIKVDAVRAFRGTMVAHGVSRGFFFTSGGFYKKAEKFGKEQGMELYTGERVLTEVNTLPHEKQSSMLREIVSTDYTTPTCVNCGIKMVRRSSAGHSYQFWGCVNFPKCRNRLELRWTEKSQGGLGRGLRSFKKWGFPLNRV